MDILLGVFITAITAIGSCIMLIATVKKVFRGQIQKAASGYMLGEGSPLSGAKAKIFNKGPVSDPMADINGGENASSGERSGFKFPRIPNMRGSNGEAGSQSNLPAVPSEGVPATGAPAGGGVGGMIGLVNVVGAMVQNGNSHNVFGARRQITGAVFQGGNMIYNQYRAKGNKKLSQRAGSIANYSAGGRQTMKQGQRNYNVISQGKVRMRSLGRSVNYINGGIKKAKFGRNNIYTPNVHIRGISSAQNLIAHNLYAPKGTKAKIIQLANGGNTLGNGYMLYGGGYAGNQPNVRLKLNDVNLQRRNEYSMQNKHFYVNKNSVNMSRFLRDPRNKDLSREQMAKLYKLTKIDSSNRYEHTDTDDLLREVVSSFPDFDTRNMALIAREARKLSAQRKRNQQLNAMESANRKVDEKKKGMEALNELLKDTSGANVGSHFQNFIDENFKEEINHDLSEEKMKKIMAEARENISKREDIPLEQKEAELEKEKERIVEELQKRNRSASEEFLKDRILDNPEEAKSVLGEDGAKMLQKQLNNIKDEKDKVYMKELLKQDMDDYSEYVNKHPELKDVNHSDLYKAKMQEELKQDIQTAYGNVKSQINSYSNEYNIH